MKKPIFFINSLLLWFVFTGGALIGSPDTLSAGETKQKSKVFEAKVISALDGDTIVLESGQKVRYIGIDAPESYLPKLGVSQFYGKEPWEYNKKLVEGKKVKLELDVQEKDPTGRLLAYVYVGDTFVNAELVKQGHALAARYPPNTKHQDLFEKLEREAKEKKIGLWGRKIPHPKKGSEYQGKSFEGVVKKAIDGDTIVLASGQEVRYIGIDAPEMKAPPKQGRYYGKESYELNKKLVEGKKVRLELEEQKMDFERRLLAHVFVGDFFVSAELVKQGRARVATFPPNIKYEELFIKLEKEAIEKKRGIWSDK
ncbi:MAG: thermonuclease family protein [Deltaproteobacteria bacterium]|nr:MAG: thermonuclease family protein [Deltaproteobacteria bacterium]